MNAYCTALGTSGLLVKALRRRHRKGTRGMYGGLTRAGQAKMIGQVR